MSKRHARWVAAGIILLIIIALALPALRTWQEHRQARKERHWILKTAGELEQSASPSVEVKGDVDHHQWIVSDYLLFSNGWAAYKIHTTHQGDPIGDIALLRTSSGEYYSSKLHYCTGLRNMMRDKDPQWPEDANDFLDYYGRDQQWNLLSQDNRVWCVVTSARRRHLRSVKSLRVWIGSRDGATDSTQFENRYKITAGFISWKVRWNSNEQLDLTVFDYGRFTPYMYGHESYLQSNYIKTITFRRDKQTGRFTDSEK